MKIQMAMHAWQHGSNGTDTQYRRHPVSSMYRTYTVITLMRSIARMMTVLWACVYRFVPVGARQT
eukprot:COSAG02_NODE_1792_length_10916_cov_169.572789_7_plen_65_part_00